MSQTVGDFVDRAPAPMGREAYVRISRRRHQRRVWCAQPRRRQDQVYPGASRGNGRLHGLGLCQILRRISASASPLQALARRILITGLYDALLDHQPVLAIVGQQARNALGGQYQQELDLVSMFKDVAGAYVAAGHVTGPGAASDRSRRPHCAVGGAVTAIILPNDLQDQPYEDPPRAHGTLAIGRRLRAAQNRAA